MLKIIKFSIIIFESLTLVQANCDFADCNHEGVCRLINSKKNCSCIGENYFQGAKCSQPINLCERDKPCKNGGKCVAVTGQFICKECNAGFGGLWCNSKDSKTFTNMLLYFNHYGFYSQPHKFLIVSETLGEQPYSLELVSDNYAIASWETTPAINGGSKWTYTTNLAAIIEKENIRYHKDLPYNKGYYYLAKETFWDYGLLNVTLRSYDTESGTKLFFLYNYQLLIMKNIARCIPQLKFLHGTNPLDPLLIDIARYNSFEAIIKNRCSNKSQVVYEWRVFNTIGTTELYDFGITKYPLLKVPPYKLWFNFEGEVMSSYQIMIRMEETHEQEVLVTQARCFILVLPKPVKAIIKGGSHRLIGVQQYLLMDASESRDFALAPNVSQDLFYSWDCISEDDPSNKYCKQDIGSSKLQPITGYLKLGAHYNFTLQITSKVNKLMSDETQQLIEVVEKNQLFLHITCVRNCLRQQFTSDSFIHLKVDKMPSGKFTEDAKFSWKSGAAVIGQEQRLIYNKTKPTDNSLKFEVVVEDEGISGKVLIELTKNPPPHGGNCTIDPLKGEAFVTQFHIKCQGYQDEDTPLYYQYQVGEFPLQRINDPEIFVKLPETKQVLVKICDQFEACADNNITVSVTNMTEAIDLKKFFKDKDSNLTKLLEAGDVLSAMILMKSLVQHINSTEDALMLITEIKPYNLATLVDIEQFFDITKSIYAKNLTLDYERSHMLARYFEKLEKGFEAVAKDHEIMNLMKTSYERIARDLWKLICEFSVKWQTLPLPVPITKPKVIFAENYLAEEYDDLPDFDIFSLISVNDWLDATMALHKSFDHMGMAGVQLYNPSEEPLLMQVNNSNLQVYALEKIEHHNITFKNESIFISLNATSIKDLQQQLQTSSVLLQIASLDNNPFWWYPDDQAPSTDVFHLSAFSRNTTSIISQINLNTPLQFELKPKNNESANLTEIHGVIKNQLHMPIFRMELNANALLLITFNRTDKPLKIKVGFTRNPRSFEVKKEGQKVNPLNLNETYEFVNEQNETAIARLALLLSPDDDELENVNFTFHTEIRECLFWDFELPDPQWSSRGCRAQLLANKSLAKILKCECYHLSTFTAKAYTKAMDSDLTDRELLQNLSTNWSMVAFYIALLIIFAIILLYNYCIYKNHKEYLTPSSYNENSDVEIRIYTGSHWNAGTSANITIRIISDADPFSITIHQNSEQPQLKRSSVCKLRISSTEVKNPRKLTLLNDRAGRYPSWYCRRIEIENMKRKEIQIFHVYQWISQNSLEVTFDPKPSTFKKNYVQNLSTYYIDWFQFNPIWGSWQHEQYNRFERSCIWISQFMATLCVVACYYGRTTMETYEEERELYYYLHFDILEILGLTCACYLAITVIKLIFVLILKAY